jgi:hypothetical protein
VTVAGGQDNDVTDDGIGGTIAGGESNRVTGPLATVAGGRFNTASAPRAVIGGGNDNTAAGDSATIIGGFSGTASGTWSTVLGGSLNVASGQNSIVAGGSNTASGTYSSAPGGFQTTASGVGSFAGGGLLNLAAGVGSFVAGGQSNLAAGDTSFVAGSRALNQDVAHDGVFLFADRTAEDFLSAAANEFAVRASGGVRLRTSGDLSTGCNLTAGSGTWACTSDRNAKRDFRPVDLDGVLRNLETMPVTSWSFRNDATGSRHIGPTAQDFRAAFGLGSGDKTIATVDADGVALAAIKALIAENRRQDERISALEEMVEAGR